MELQGLPVPWIPRPGKACLVLSPQAADTASIFPAVDRVGSLGPDLWNFPRPSLDGRHQILMFTGTRALCSHKQMKPLARVKQMGIPREQELTRRAPTHVNDGLGTTAGRSPRYLCCHYGGEKHPQKHDSAVARKVSSGGRKDCLEICSKL